MTSANGRTASRNGPPAHLTWRHLWLGQKSGCRALLVHSFREPVVNFHRITPYPIGARVLQRVLSPAIFPCSINCKIDVVSIFVQTP
jgi:hypothetical protein